MPIPRQKKIPTGALGALVALLAIEVALRFTNPAGTLRWNYGERGYRAIVPELLAVGAQPVSIVGNSRAREGILAPVLTTELGGTASGNYGMGGAHGEEGALVVMRLLEAEPKPRAIVWPISPRELVGRASPGPKAALIFRLSDWWRHSERFGPEALGVLPEAVRNELARVSLLLRYRPEVQRLLFEPDKGESLMAGLSRLVTAADERSPFGGDLPPWKKGRSRFVSKKVSAKRVKKYLADQYTPARWPSPRQLEAVEAAAERCRAEGVPLLLLELPQHPLLVSGMGRDVLPRFRTLIAQIALRTGASYVSLQELHASFEPRDFREQSHLNYRGALKLTRAVAPRVARAIAAR